MHQLPRGVRNCGDDGTIDVGVHVAAVLVVMKASLTKEVGSVCRPPTGVPRS